MKLLTDLDIHEIHEFRNLSLHSCGFSCPVVSQEGRDLSLIEVDVETVDCWTRASRENLHQVLDLDSQDQAHRFGLKEQLTCDGKQAQKMGLTHRLIC